MKPWLRCALAIALLLPLYGAIDLADPRWSGFDAHRYDAMRAAAPHLAAVRRPEAFRLAGPWLAAVFGFRAVTWSALVGCAVLLRRYLRGEGITDGAAAVAVTLFAMNRPLVGQLAWNPYQAADALGLLALLAALVALRERRYPIFGVCVALGCLARETPLLAIPVAVLAYPSARRWCLPGVAVFIALRLAIRPGDEEGMSLLGALRYWAPAKLTPEPLIRAAVAFAPVTLVPIVAWRRVRSAFRAEHAALLVGTALSTLFGADAERLWLPAASVIYLLVGRAVDGWPRWAAIGLLLAGAIAMLHHQVGVARLPSRDWTAAAMLAAVAAATWIAVRVERGRRAVSSEP